jgi:hypothetical protein
MSDISNVPTIVVCVDTNNASITALRYACYRAKKLGFAVQVLVVMDVSHKNLLFGSRAISQDKKQQIEKKLQKLLDGIYSETAFIPAVSIREGDITSEIIKEIRSIPKCANLIFGKSNNPLSDNTVLPKVIQKISDKIKVPVVIIPENLTEDYFKGLS